MANNKHILSTGKGKNKREFELNNEEWDRFLLYFEECELIEIPAEGIGKLTLVEKPF